MLRRPREAKRSLGDVVSGIVGGRAGSFAHTCAHVPNLRAYVSEVVKAAGRPTH